MGDDHDLDLDDESACLEDVVHSMHISADETQVTRRGGHPRVTPRVGRDNEFRARCRAGHSSKLLSPCLE